MHVMKVISIFRHVENRPTVYTRVYTMDIKFRNTYCEDIYNETIHFTLAFVIYSVVFTYMFEIYV